MIVGRRFVVIHSVTEPTPIGNLHLEVARKLEEYGLSSTSCIEILVIEGRPTFVTEIPLGWKEPVG